MMQETKIKTMGTVEGFPAVVFEYERSYLFGWIRIKLLVEDRRPDLAEMIGKYKHQIYFKLFWKEVSVVTRSTSGPGSYSIDGKSMDLPS